MQKNSDKFEFDTDFQENLLQYTVTDKNGYRALTLYEDHNFTLLEHQIIAAAIIDFNKRKKRLPQSKTILREHLRKILLSKDYINAVTNDDKVRINKIVTRLYRGPVKDGDAILEAALQFSRYVSLKDVLEDVNLTAFDKYETYSEQIRKAINKGVEFKEEQGTFVISGIRDRQYRRKISDEVIPCCINQLNKFTNANGFTKGSVVVILSPEKEFKTGLLINVARKGLRLRKKILYIDLENGQDNLATRLEQSIMNKPKMEILSGEYDEKVQRQLRKYQRLGAEVDIKRFPAYITDCNHIQAYIDNQYREFGLRYNELIIDGPHLMASISGLKDEEPRIGAVFIEIKNLTDKNKYDICWTPAHTKREAKKRFKTNFTSEDIAKCIDLARTVDAIFGYNRSDLDVQLGIGRLEIIEQRDGVNQGAALFKVNYKHQRADELTKTEVDAYYAALKNAGHDTPRHEKDL